MLFNSYGFLFLFLPLTLFTFFSTAKINKNLALFSLLVASLIFYSWLNIYYGIILVSSIIVNFFIATKIIAATKHQKTFLVLGIIFNLGLLGYFKYANFFIENINYLSATQISLLNIALPLGISFFTFTQLAFLVDSYRGLVKDIHWLHFGLFVTYFPHLIAGPIIHHSEIMPQFSKNKNFKLNSRNLLLGLIIFTLGLFKKVVLADQLANWVAPVFDTHPAIISTSDAWIASLAYTFELYFDFSGYSDMAIGLSLMFSIKLPINFYSPYKAENIIEFWRRWNMTLSRFLRNYLYIPLGGNRNGVIRKYINLLITMILGGLWHGASWTFVIWGGLHGLYLCINHGWVALKKFLNLSEKNNFLTVQISRLLTFAAVVIAWVFFRAPDFATAFHIVESMFYSSIFSPIVLQFFSQKKIIIVLFVSFAIAWGPPNIYQIFERYQIALMKKTNNIKYLFFKPSFTWNTAIAGLFVIATCLIQTSNTFLYFQF